MTTRAIATVAIVVADYDEAIDYYTRILGFVLVDDTPLGDGKRWVRIRPSEGAATSFLLARASNDGQRRRIGDQTGGRVAFFLETDDFWRDYRAMKVRGVDFREEPRQEDYGTVVVFADLYGNLFDLIEPGPAAGIGGRP
jgi:catechol 2,3-dioxygenase-like lactoylglutathione lyase family enzyme